jgi:hypothetical protein
MRSVELTPLVSAESKGVFHNGSDGMNLRKRFWNKSTWAFSSLVARWLGMLHPSKARFGSLGNEVAGMQITFASCLEACLPYEIQTWSFLQTYSSIKGRNKMTLDL